MLSAAGVRPGDESTLEHIALTQECLQLLSSAVTELPPELRAVIHLKYFDSLPWSAICRRLNVSLDTARHRRKKALQELEERLRPILDQRGGYVPSLLAIASLRSEVVGALATKGFWTWCKSLGIYGVSLVVVALIPVCVWLLAATGPDVRPAAVAESLATFDPPGNREQSSGDPGNTNYESSLPPPVLSPPTRLGVRVFGRCLSASDGLPLAHVRVSSDEWGEFTTDTDGRFTLNGWETFGGDSLYSIKIERPTFVTRYFSDLVKAGDDVNLGDVRLTGAGVIRGSIVDERNRPIPGVGVAVGSPLSTYRWERYYHGLIAFTTSDVDGRFVLPNVPAQWVRLYAQMGRGPITRTEPFSVTLGETNAPLTVRLATPPDSEYVTGIVLDTDGRPLANGTIYWTPRLPHDRPDPTEITADGDGRIRVWSYPYERHDFSISNWLGTCDSAKDVVAGRDPFILRMRPCRESTIRIVSDDTGTPIDTARGWRINDGYVHALGTRGALIPFAISEKPFGIRVWAWGFQSERLDNIDPDTVGAEIEIRLKPHYGIRGRVVDTSGHAIANAFVHLDAKHGRPWSDVCDEYPELAQVGAARTAADGSFIVDPAPVLEGNEPEEVELYADARGYVSSQLEPIACLSSEHEKPFTIVLRRSGGIAVHVIPTREHGTSDILVRVYRTLFPVCVLRADSAGNVRASDLEPGQWHIDTLREEDVLDYSRELVDQPGTTCYVEEGKVTELSLVAEVDPLCSISGVIRVDGVNGSPSSSRRTRSLRSPSAGWGSE